MRIAFFTPTSDRSAIGEVSRRVIEELRSTGVEVRVISTDTEMPAEAESHAQGTKAVHWANISKVKDILADVDLPVYQIGDYFPFHEGSLFWLQREPGLVCLHDFYLASLFSGWKVKHENQASSVLIRHYGSDAPSFFEAAVSGVNFVLESSAATPMTEWIASLATSVLTHSHWAIERVLTSCPGPVATAALPFLPEPTEHESNTVSETHLGQDAKFSLLTFGHVISNKRVAQVMQAISADANLREGVQYRVVGKVDDLYREELSGLAVQLGVSLTLTGEVSNGVLRQEILSASLVSCLRDPTLEAASASAIEAIGYGKAVMVSNHGFYAELPSEMVLKVDPKNEFESLKQTLSWSIENQAELDALGLKARDWARGHFSTSDYVKELLKLAENDLKSRPPRKAVQALAADLGRFGGNPDLLSTKSALTPLEIFED